LTGCRIDRHSRLAYARKLWNEVDRHRTYRSMTRPTAADPPLVKRLVMSESPSLHGD
jgi:hypothetical protein